VLLLEDGDQYVRDWVATCHVAPPREGLPGEGLPGEGHEEQEGQEGQGHEGQEGQGHEGQEGQGHEGQEEGQGHEGQEGQGHEGQEGQGHEGQEGQGHEGQEGQGHEGQEGQEGQGRSGVGLKGQLRLSMRSLFFEPWERACAPLLVPAAPRGHAGAAQKTPASSLRSTQYVRLKARQQEAPDETVRGSRGKSKTLCPRRCGMRSASRGGG